MSGIGLRTFCHVTLRVSDMEKSLAFYRDVVGLQVIFDVELDGEGLDSITGIAGSKGRMVGTVAPGGTMVEMVSGVYPEPADGSPRGAGDSVIFSLSVEDVERAHEAFVAAGIEPLQRPAEIDGTRMFFVLDPDGRRVEFVEYPGGAPRAAEMHGWSG
ncbi:MAG: VOC family protein [Proteobacteria bacterium]|nr:VOC family protein [Pseudomonadota bacterium]